MKFLTSEAKILEKSIVENEIILINSRNDPNLDIKPLEEVIGEELRNVIVSPVSCKLIISLI